MSANPDPASNVRLLALLAKGGGPARQKDIVPEIKAAHKKALVAAGFVASEKAGLVVTGAGRAHALAILAGPLLGGRPTSNEKLLAFFVNRLAVYAMAKGAAIADILGAPAPPDLTRRIRDAYDRAKKGSGLARLAVMRAHLDDLDRRDVDEAIKTMHEANRLTLMREDNQRDLSAADREAAIDYKGEPRHIIMWVS
jgi:hypothetical protein